MLTHNAVALLDVSFIVDYPNSTRDSNATGVDNWRHVIDFIVRIVSAINVGENTTHVGVVSFGMQLKTLQFLRLKSQYIIHFIPLSFH